MRQLNSIDHSLSRDVQLITVENGTDYILAIAYLSLIRFS